jgi:hypothetical protein
MPAMARRSLLPKLCASLEEFVNVIAIDAFACHRPVDGADP